MKQHKCFRCGTALEKKKLTLYITKELIDKAKEKNINISKLLEETLINYFTEIGDLNNDP